MQNQVQATHLLLEGDDLGWGAPGLGDDLGWGAPGLGDDLGWGGEATRDAHGCGGGPLHLGLLERDITHQLCTKAVALYRNIK